MSSKTHYDAGSARLMLSYLGRALKHYDERQFAKQKLRIELKKLKKVSTKSMKKYLDNLEGSISDAIKKEQRILKHQQKEDVFHGNIKERIKELEGRLSRYLAIHEARAQKVRLLENAMASEQLHKEEKISTIKKSLAKVEKIHKDLSKNKKYSKKQVADIGRVIERIRKKVREAEKQ